MPLAGGLVIDRVGLLPGFDGVLFASAAGYVACAAAARRAAAKHVSPRGAPPDPPRKAEAAPEV